MSQEIPPPIQSNTYALHDDEGPVPKTLDSHHVGQHPNGSEGWLPVSELPEEPSHTVIPPRDDTSTQQGHSTILPTTKNGTSRSPSSAGSGSILHSRRATTANYPPSQKDNETLQRSSSKRSVHTTSHGKQLPGGAFVGGAGATGPNSTAGYDDELVNRRMEANNNLTPKQRSKVFKSEVQNSKRLSKIIKNEAKTEKQALGLAIDELEELQKYQKNAVKSEARVKANHSKLLARFKKDEAAYLNAKMRYETSLAELRSEEEALETLRNNAREATERMQDKAAEIDSLRVTFSVDEREREVKLNQLKGKHTMSKQQRSENGTMVWRN